MAVTDRERLLELLGTFGLQQAPSLDGAPDDVRLEANEGGMGGYPGFYVAFTFDGDGKFMTAGVWE